MLLEMRGAFSATDLQAMAVKCRAMAQSTDDPRAIDSLLKLAGEYEGAARAAARDALSEEDREAPRRARGGTD